ncbi:alpha/beta fold hydrolase [Thalassotalea fusca]
MKFKVKLGAIAMSSLVLISGCQSDQGSQAPEPIPVTSENVISIGDRFYHIAKPTASFNPNRVYKLLMAFHPSGGSAGGMQSLTQFETRSDDYIVVYPQSKVEEWEEGCMCNKPYRLGVDDLSYVDNVIADVKTRFHIDSNEIYAVGYSQGGLFTQNLLCNRSHVFNGIVSVGAPMSIQLSETCSIGTPTDYMMVHGTADNVLPYYGRNQSTFTLIASEKAIEVIARLNQITVEKQITDPNDRVQVHEYRGEETVNKLIAVKKGGHSWRFTGYETSDEVLQFFEQVSNTNLPDNSHIYNVNDRKYHVRSMGDNTEKPAIILLSGPNYNFHSDSAWYSLLQPVLAEQYRVHVIDRLGNGYSEFSELASYQALGDDLPEILKAIEAQSVLLVGFSSSNIATKLFIDNHKANSAIDLAGVVWIDPDTLTDDSIAFYQDYPVSWYREKLPQLIPYLESGAWTERTAAKVALEREEIASLIPQQWQEKMDWTYFDDISQRRLSIAHQQTRAIEIAHYHDDLELSRQFTFTNAVPISIIDSDFELKDIANANEEDKPRLIKWMNDSSAWSESVSALTGGVYHALENADHMVMFEHPQAIVDVIEQTLALSQ